MTDSSEDSVRSLGYWIDGLNGKGRKVRVWQPFLGAAKVTAARLTDEGMTNVEIKERYVGDE